MYIIKVRDHITAATRGAVSERGYNLLKADDGKWKTAVIQYRVFADAVAAVDKQIPQADGNNRACVKRDLRIYEQIGRKQTLVFERLARD